MASIIITEFATRNNMTSDVSRSPQPACVLSVLAQSRGRYPPSPPNTVFLDS